MSIMNYKEAYLRAKEVDKDIRVGAHFLDIIEFKHGDGSQCEFHHATFQKLSNEWMAIFTEHHGFFVYHVEDLEWVKKRSQETLYYRIISE